MKGHFIDHPSLHVIKRYTPNVSFLYTQHKGIVMIENDVFCLYFNCDEPPHHNLRVDVKGYSRPYILGQKLKRNLKGTARTLDQVTGI